MQRDPLQRFANRMIHGSTLVLRSLWAYLRYWPRRETRQELSGVLTIYGFWIGILLAVVAIVLYLDITKTLIAAKPEQETPVITDIKAEIMWKADYEPPTQVEEALQRLLMGKVYEQPVFDYEAHEFLFPDSLNDFPKGPRPHGPEEIVFLPWRIGAVPPLSPDETPLTARLPLSGDYWRWNIHPEVMSHILSSHGEPSSETAWYKVAIAMVGGYSHIAGPGLPIDTYKAAIDAFEGAVWTFEAKCKVWNSGNVATKLASITLKSDITEIIPPAGVDPDAFTIQPGYRNALEFTLVPKSGHNTQRSVENEAAYIRENAELHAPAPEERWVTKPSTLAWLMAGAVLVGAFLGTATMKVGFFFRRGQP